MTNKQKVSKLAADLGVKIKIRPIREVKVGRIELHFPEGVDIDGLTSVTCHNWEDAYNKLQRYAPLIIIVQLRNQEVNDDTHKVVPAIEDDLLKYYKVPPSTF